MPSRFLRPTHARGSRHTAAGEFFTATLFGTLPFLFFQGSLGDTLAALGVEGYQQFCNETFWRKTLPLMLSLGSLQLIPPLLIWFNKGGLNALSSARADAASASGAAQVDTKTNAKRGSETPKRGSETRKPRLATRTKSPIRSPTSSAMTGGSGRRRKSREC